MQTSVTTDTSGAVTSRTRYKPFGEVLTTSGSETSGTLNTDRKFGGQTFDTGTDMYFYSGRYYDRTLRRFISAEGYMPAFNAPQTLNRYSFGGNNPLSPTGDVASFSGVAVARYKPSNHNGLPVSSSNAGGTKAVSQESAGSANQGFAWQMAMLNLHSHSTNLVLKSGSISLRSSEIQSVQLQPATVSAQQPQPGLGPTQLQNMVFTPGTSPSGKEENQLIAFESIRFRTRGLGTRYGFTTITGTISGGRVSFKMQTVFDESNGFYVRAEHVGLNNLPPIELPIGDDVTHPMGRDQSTDIPITTQDPKFLLVYIRFRGSSAGLEFWSDEFEDWLTWNFGPERIDFLPIKKKNLSP